MPVMAMGAVPWWHAQRRPQAIALVHGDTALSWESLARHSARKARALQSFGVGENDCVTIALPNGNTFFEAVFAVLMAGATPNPVSAQLPVHELRGILELARPRAIIGGDPQALGGWPVLPTDWAERASSDEPLPEAVANHWKIMTSGGSTGRPKLIVDRRPASIDPSRYDLFDWNDHQGRLGRPDGVFLNPGPLYHNGPFTFSMINLLAGSTVAGQARFDPEETLRQIEAHRVEFLYLVPTMMHRIWNLPREVRDRYNLSSLRGAVHLGAPCSRWLKESWIAWLGAERVWELYGSTEAITSTLIDGVDWLRRPGSVGKFTRGGRGCVMDAAGKELPPGEIGELWMRPAPDAAPTYEYIGAEPRVRDGWESVGDLGWMDAEGYVYISDRRADLILRGGANIYPAEVEAELDAHPDIASCAVIGLPDAEWGARVHAIVQPKPEARDRLSAEQLREFLKDRLITYKQPASYEFVDGSLRDEAGKIRRSALIAERR